MSTYEIKPLFKPEIDKFIENLSDDAKNKLWKIIEALKLEFELTGSNKFKIPFDKFKQNKSSDEDSRAILINLHKNKILEISTRLKIKYKPDRFSIKTIEDEPDIYTFPNTEIKIEKDKLVYLEAKLKYFIHPELSINYLVKIEDSTSNTSCVIRKNSLKLIASKIDSIQSLKENKELGRFLIDCGVKKELCIGLLVESVFKPPTASDVYSYENILQAITNPAPTPTLKKESRAGYLYRIMIFYSCSKYKNKEILFKIIEEASHPLLFNASKKASNIFQERLNSILEFDGYYLENGKIEKNEEESIIIKTIEKKGDGFLKINEQEIPIGLIKTGKYQLLKALCYPDIGLARPIDDVFKIIEKYTNKKTSDVDDKYLKTNYKETKLKGFIKEIQRKMSSYTTIKRIKFNIKNKKIWISLD